VPNLFTFKIQHFVPKCFVMCWVWVVPLVFSLSYWDLFARERFLSLFLHLYVPFPFMKEREITEAWRFPRFVTSCFQVPPFEYARRFQDLMWTLFIISSSLTSS